MAVAAVDEDIPLVQQRKELIYKLIHSAACLDHHEHLARLFKRGNKLLKTMRADDILSGRAAGDKFVHLLGVTVIHRDREALGLHIHDEIFTHHRKADEADIRFFIHAVHLFTLALPL